MRISPAQTDIVMRLKLSLSALVRQVILFFIVTKHLPPNMNHPAAFKRCATFV
jgi:hypothetical protein